MCDSVSIMMLYLCKTVLFYFFFDFMLPVIFVICEVVFSNVSIKYTC